MISNEENIIAWNSYFYPHTDTFINKLNIKDKAELQKKDASISLKKLNILLLNSDNVTIFDSNYLKSIHYFIFNELYPWAVFIELSIWLKILAVLVVLKK